MSNNALGMRVLTDMSSQLKTTNRAFANAIRKNIRAGVQDAGGDVVSKIRAGANWSTRIPSAVKITTRFNPRGASVRVVVDKRVAPHARAYELGNKNNFSQAAIDAHGGYKIVNGRRVAVKYDAYKAIKASGVGVTRMLRHPVYDSGRPPKRVGEQPTRPFFFPAITASARQIDLRMERAVIQSAREAGFK